MKTSACFAQGLGERQQCWNSTQSPIWTVPLLRDALPWEHEQAQYLKQAKRSISVMELSIGRTFAVALQLRAMLKPSQCHRELPPGKCGPSPASCMNLPAPSWTHAVLRMSAWCFGAEQGKNVSCSLLSCRELLWGILTCWFRSCCDRCSASLGDIRGDAAALKPAMLTQGSLPVPGKTASPLHVLLVYIIHIQM